MKSLIVSVVLVMIGSSSLFAQTKAGKKDTAQHTVFYTYTCPMHPEVKNDKAGRCTKCGMDLTLSKKEELKREVTKKYTCSVHQQVVSNKPGTCPKCQARLVIDRRSSKQGKVVYTGNDSKH